ncbi:MAG: IPT/TIG domain-containing protein [Bryobacteraceae bacterium]
MRFTLLSTFAFLSLSVSAFSQTQILTCNATSVPPIVRGEGITERVGDIVVDCSGGTPNTQMTGNFSIFLSVNITNRISGNAVTGVVFTIDNGSGPQPVTAPGIIAGPSNLVYNGVSFALSPAGSVTLRIANIRAAANQLMFTSNLPIQAFLALNASNLVNLTNSHLPVATVVRGLYAGYASKLICSATGSALPTTLTFSNLIAAGTSLASTRVTEGFADSFGQRSTWANLNADSGERIIVRYSGFTPGARIFVPDVVAGSDAVQPTAGGDFGLPASGGKYAAGGNGSLLLARVPGADANGAGGTPVFVPSTATGTLSFDSVSEVPLSNGSGHLVYEVVDANPSALESAQFPAFLGLAPSGNGSSSVTSEDVSLAPVSTVMIASATDPIPRFLFTSAPPDCALIGDCGASYQPRLFVDPLILQYTATAGSSFQVAYLRVNNQGGGVMHWTAKVTYQSGSGWLRVDPVEGVNNATIRIDALPGNLAPGTYQASLTIDAGPQAGARTVGVTLVITAALPPPVQLPEVSSVMNAASFTTGPIAPGSLATILGTRLGGKNVAVTFDGLPGSILFGNDTQINVLVPAALGSKASAQAVVSVDGNQSAAQPVALAAMAPAIFPGAVLNQDYSANSSTNPAAPGSVIQIFATGLSGSGAITARLAGRVIDTPYYAGPAPGLLGVQQIDLIVPQDLIAGTADVIVCGNAVCSPAAKVISY